jgi:hypothetical protein
MGPNGEIVATDSVLPTPALYHTKPISEQNKTRAEYSIVMMVQQPVLPNPALYQTKPNQYQEEATLTIALRGWILAAALLAWKPIPRKAKHMFTGLETNPQESKACVYWTETNP